MNLTIFGFFWGPTAVALTVIKVTHADHTIYFGEYFSKALSS